MKGSKIFALASLAIVIGLSSCGKSDYQCVCNYEEIGVPMTHVKTYKDIRKKDAKEDCATLNIEFKKCELKDM